MPQAGDQVLNALALGHISHPNHSNQDRILTGPQKVELSTNIKINIRGLDPGTSSGLKSVLGVSLAGILTASHIFTSSVTPLRSPSPIFFPRTCCYSCFSGIWLYAHPGWGELVGSSIPPTSCYSYRKL